MKTKPPIGSDIITRSTPCLLVILLAILGRSAAMELRGNVSPSGSILEYAQGRNVGVEFTSVFPLIPVVSVEPRELVPKVEASFNGFTAHAKLHTKAVAGPDGNPLLGSDAVFAPINNRPGCIFRDPDAGLMFASAADSDGGMPWQPVLVDPAESSGVRQLLSVGGHPLVVYAASADGRVTVARASDTRGAGPWTLVKTPLKGLLRAAELDGVPAVLLNENGLVLARAADEFGNGPWAQTLIAPGAVEVSELILVNGRPALAYVDRQGHPHFARAADAQGNGPWSDTALSESDIAAGISMKSYFTGLAFMRALVVSYAHQHEQGSSLIIQSPKDENGLQPWTRQEISEAGSDSWGMLTTLSVTRPSIHENTGAKQELVIGTYHQTGAGGSLSPGRMFVRNETGAWVKGPAVENFWRHEWQVWNGRNVLVGDALSFSAFPELTWRATEGVQTGIRRVERRYAVERFVSGPGAPFCIYEDGPNRISHDQWGNDWIAEVADMNGDSHMDVVMAVEGYPSFQILLGDGKGAMTPWFSVPAGLPASMAIERIEVADVNNDKKLDLVLLGIGGTFPNSLHREGRVLLSDGVGGFRRGDFTLYGLPVIRIFPEDVNGDGMVDYVAVDSAVVTTYFGDGKGGASKGPESPHSFDPSQWPSFWMEDFNNDGTADLLRVIWGEQVTVMLGDGTGNFLNDIRSPVAAVSAVGDLDGDGIPDLVAVRSSPLSPHGRGGVSLALGDGSGKFTVVEDEAFQVGGDFGGPLGVHLADMNRDRRPDLVIGYSSGAIGMRFGDGKGTFGKEHLVAATSDSRPNRLLSTDLDHDGLNDLIALDGNGKINWLVEATGKLPLQVDFVGIPDHAYDVQYTPNLTNRSWSRVVRLVADPNGRFQTSHLTSNSQGYYRAAQK